MRRVLFGLLFVAACHRPHALPRPGEGDGIALFDAEPRSIAVLFPADQSPRWIGTLPDDPSLWLEYPASSLGTFLGPDLLADGAEIRSIPDGPDARGLPLPEVADAWAGDWTRIDDVAEKRLFAEFRLPGLDPFECAARGGCYPVEAKSTLTCGPCAIAPGPEVPAPPEPPRFLPCLPTWTATIVAGVEACRPPPPCDPDEGACPEQRDCPGRSVLDRPATMRVGGPDCGGVDWPCDLTEALDAVDAQQLDRVVLALAEGEHQLLAGTRAAQLRLVGLCPARTTVILEGDLSLPGLVVEDLSLVGRGQIESPVIALDRIVGREDVLLSGPSVTIANSLFVDGTLEIHSGTAAIDRSRFHRIANFESDAVLSIRDSALTEIGFLDHDGGQWSMARSLLESSRVGCLHGAMSFEDAFITTRGKRMVAGSGCGFSLVRTSWEHESTSLEAEANLLFADRELTLTDVAFSVRGEVAFAMIRAEAPVAARRVAIRGVMARAFELRDDADAVFEDLVIHFDAPARIDEGSPPAFDGASHLGLELHRARITGPAGLALEVQVKAGVEGRIDVADLEVDGARLGGVATQASQGRGARWWLHDLGGAAFNTYGDGNWSLVDVRVERIGPIVGSCGRLTGLSCTGAGLIAQLASSLSVDRFVVEGTAAPAVAILNATATASRGVIRAETAFYLDRFVGDPARLLLGVSVDVGQGQVVGGPGR